MEVYLIRHTTPEVAKGTCYGQSDVDLAPSFSEEYATLKTILPDTFDRIYSSTLTRCTRLAEKLSSSNPVITDKRLMELNFGQWELRAWDSISSAEMEPWMKDFVQVRTPGGEDFSMLYNRTKAFYEELLLTSDQRVAVVCHAGVIRAFLAIILEFPLRNAFRIPVSYASVTKLNLNTETCYCSLEYLNRIHF